MERLLNAEVAAQIKGILADMRNEITIKLFIDGSCDTCLETKQLLTETAELNSKIKLIVHDSKTDAEEAAKYDITLFPSFIFLDDQNVYRGVKFSGFPGGHEINSFLSAIIEMSGNHFAFSQEVLDRVAKIDKPVDIKVFVTLSCQYCPPAVETAHRLAMLNPNIKGVMIEAQTFNDMSNKYKVSGVPKIVINDMHELLGNQPVEEFLKKIELL